MKFSALAISSVFAASSAFAGFMPTVTLTATSSGTGAYQIAGNTWTINFYTDADLSQSGTVADFGNWILSITGTNGMTWQTSSSETVGGSYRNVTGARIYTVDMADGEGSELPGTGDLSPIPGKISVRFTTPKNNGTFVNLQDALNYSSSPTTANDRRGTITVTSTDGMSTIDGFFATTVPAPGAAALVGLAGLIVSRRRV